MVSDAVPPPGPVASLAAEQTAVAPPRRPRRTAWLWSGGVLALLLGALGLCEVLGWPFLARPAEHWIGQRLGRVVVLEGSPAQPFQLHLLGGVSLQLGRLQIGGPAWAPDDPTLQATSVTLRLRYADLLALRDSDVLHIAQLSAATLGLHLKRRADGSASWLFAKAGAANPRQFRLRAEQLWLTEGSAVVDDAVREVVLTSHFALTPEGTLSARADGQYQRLPLVATLHSDAALPWLANDPKAKPATLALRMTVGSAKLAFDGQASDLMGSQHLDGRYQVSGPSLAAVGAPLRLTLPSTGAFAMQGRLVHQKTQWLTVVEQASIGRSRLHGEFTFDTPPKAVPTLAGRLHGQVLWLADLGPAIGLPAEPLAKGVAQRVLPSRPFDLQALRKMNANVLVDIDRLESGSKLLQAVAPFRTHVLLGDGVLALESIDARLAQGQLRGHVRLDGRSGTARWQTSLSASGMLLEQWIRQTRSGAKPPYASGRLAAQVELHGVGRSTAELLASADGRALLHWHQGKVSHLAVELAGLDLAQALGVVLRGDDSLDVNCGAADLVVAKGLITPRVLLVDTRESTIWLDGSMSLASEKIALVAHVAPKDFSPLTLRTPIHIDGSLQAPKLSLEKAPLLRRLVPALLLAAVSPLVAVLPMVDAGDPEMSAQIAACRALGGRGLAQVAAGAPASIVPVAPSAAASAPVSQRR